MSWFLWKTFIGVKIEFMKPLFLPFIAILLIPKLLEAQSSCNLLTKYSRDGVSIQYTSPINIDSTNDCKCAIGLQNIGTYT